jgi:hypothetical protein
VKEFVSYDADRDRLLFATETGVRSLTADTSQWATTPQIEEITGLDSPTRPLLHFGTSRIYFGACATTCANGRLYEIDLAVPATWSAPTTYDVPGVGGLGSVIIDRSQSPALLHAGSRSGRIVAIEIPL